MLPQEVMIIEVFWSEIDKYFFRELRDRVNILISFWLQMRYPRKRVLDWVPYGEEQASSLRSNFYLEFLFSFCYSFGTQFIFATP